MKAKLFTKAVTTSAYGKKITVYRSIDAKISVELMTDLDGEYWWTKVKQVNGVGKDGAFNLPDSQCLALVAIFKSIARENWKAKGSNA